MFLAARARLGTLVLSHATTLRPLVLHSVPRGFGASEWGGQSVRAMSSGGPWGWWGRGGDDDDDKKDDGDAEGGGEKDAEADQDADGEGSKRAEQKKGRRRRRTETEAIEVVDNNTQSRGQNAQRVRSSGGGSAALTRVGSGDEAPRIPRVIALPVSPRPVFPTTTHPLRIEDKTLIETLTRLHNAGSSWLGVFLRQAGDGEAMDTSDVINSVNDVHAVGTLASILHIRQDDNAAQLIVQGHRRIRAVDEVQGSVPLQLRIEHLDEEAPNLESETVKAYTNELISTMREVVTMNPMLREYINGFYMRFDVRDPYRLADFAASIATASSSQDGYHVQQVLEAVTLEDRLEKALMVIKRERELVRVQQEISKQVDEKISGNQRKYFLMEQLKQIKKELGLEKDDKEALMAKYQERLEGLELPEEASKTIEEEMEKLNSLEKNSSEFNVTRSYLDWLTSLPWGKYSEENFEIPQAREVLEREHYGLSDIKDRILEFIAVGNLKGSVHGKILCFVGPPGVGKTSIGKSIAEALNREYFRFSVGGLSDVSEIKGHRRTYVGAMPGKVIQALKTVQSNNPLVLIDEVDKLGRGLQGDPASALLELLDPNQNSGFVDHYLDVPVDLSKVLFICTANVLDTIPGPLKDRMEIIRLAGYDQPEKVQIATRYLDKKAREQTGLEVDGERTPASLKLTEDAVESLIRWYCREAGVRNLEKHIERIYRKAALEVVSATEEELKEKDWVISEDKLEHYVGKHVFTSDRLYEVTPPGVTMGLAWTSMGGTALYIETTYTRRKENPVGGLQVTGQLGEVMKESSHIALTFAKQLLNKVEPENNFFDVSEIHVHVPEGATPKDGPSAGVTMTTSLISLATNRPVRSDVAMTGEVSLTGKVLPVGGIKEKVIAARRSGVHTVVLPKANQKDVDELPDYLKEGLTVHLADTYDQVFEVAFGTSVSEFTPAESAMATEAE